MGNTRYTADKWDSSATVTRARAPGATAYTTTSRTVNQKMVPKTIAYREARDSVANPNSLPIILALDVTGSMSDLVKTAIDKYNMVIDELVTKKAIPDPALMTMFLDDVWVCDPALQVTQFESDEKVAEQLGELYITSNGGGNGSESYHLPLYMAAFKTRTDAFEKRQKKGYLFITGDELMPPPLTPEQIKHVFGPDENVTEPLSYMDLFHAASRMYNVFHIACTRGSDAQYRKAFKEIGESLICLDDLDKMPEIIVSTIRIIEGEDAAAVAKSWSGTTAVTVAKATGHLAKKSTTSGDATGAVKL